MWGKGWNYLEIGVYGWVRVLVLFIGKVVDFYFIVGIWGFIVSVERGVFGII